jgi:predicted GTPase
MPLVVLVGRPTREVDPFNRIIGSRRAIVAPIAGTTRDSQAFPASGGMSFQLADKAGFTVPARSLTNWSSCRESAPLRGGHVGVSP